MRKKLLELDSIEVALLIGCIARSKAEIELLSDRFLKEFKADLDKLLEKLES